MAEAGSAAGNAPNERGATRSDPLVPGNQVPLTEEQLRAVTIGEPTRLSGPIAIAEYDPAWPTLFAREAGRVRDALGVRVLLLEHVGSTSVPGLAAKPWIDMLLVVADSADESAYVPDLQAAGYVLRIREPTWYEHRMFRDLEANVQIHVFSPGCPEVDHMLLFRDHLRANESDRRLHERTKRELAQREWTYVQNYADAKSDVVEEIMARARRKDAEDPDQESYVASASSLPGKLDMHA